MRGRIPTNLKLDPREVALVEEWMRHQLARKPTAEEDIDCCGSSSFTFSGFATGIGDCWKVTRGTDSLHFGIDDNDEPYYREETKA